MNRIVKHSVRELTYRFHGPDFMPADEDEGALRDVQWERRSLSGRQLKSAEIELLSQQGNTASDWSTIRVTERFNPKLVRGCRFGGFVRLGDMENLILDFEGLRLPVGLYNSVIISSDIGANVAVNRVAFMSNMLIGDEVILHGIGQMQTRDGARFGGGFLWEKESEAARKWLELCNESGNRRIVPFAGILPADASLWAKYRDDTALMDRLREMTDRQGNQAGVRYGTVGNRTVIRDTHTLIDVHIGSDAVIEGVHRIENVTVLSDAREGTRISEGASLIDGIVGYGCQVGVGVQAQRFVLGTRAKLLHGARLMHSFLGDNSTVACCEVAHCLIFPNHEQHHNNSFLIAATMQGQSNIAAGATIGSNHNSRAAEGEILAERGFWPGLCSSFKHPSRFAPYTLVAKGHYANELNIPYPFSLVSNNEHLACLQVIPAYWFLYNMYAVLRNEWKFRARDQRQHADQHIEFDALAPDTVESILSALARLEEVTARAWLACQENGAEPPTAEDRGALGRRLLLETPEALQELEILDEGLENSPRKVRLFKVAAAYASYREMALYYAVRTVIEFMPELGIEDLGALAGFLIGERERQWVNLGGQIMASSDLQRLKERIAAGELDSWEAIHAEYDRFWEEYPLAKARHAFAVLLALEGKNATELSGADWADWLERAVATQDAIAEQAYATRAKDFTSPMRQITFDSAEEMAAVVGSPDEDPFVARVRQQAESFQARVEQIRQRNGLAD